MKSWVFFLPFFAIVFFLGSAALAAVPKEFQPLLKEARGLITKCKSNVIYNNQAEGAAEQIAKAEALISELMSKAGITQADPDIARLNESIKEIKEKLDQLKAAKTPPSKIESPALNPPPAEGGPSYWDKKNLKENEAKDKAAVEIQEPLKIFNAYKDEMASLYEVMNRIRSTKDFDELLSLAGSSRGLFERANEVAAEMRAGIPSMEKIEEYSDEAKALHPATMLNKITGSLAESAKERLAAIIPDLLAYIQSDLDLLKTVSSPGAAYTVTGRIKERFSAAAGLDPDNGKLKEAQALIMQEVDKTLAALKKKIADVRMPADNYSGNDKEALKKALALAYEEKYRDGRVERVVITSGGWQEQLRAGIDNDGRISAGWYKYLYAAVAVNNTGACTVYETGFRRSWTGRGDAYGPLELHSIGGGFPILEENLAK